MKKTLALLLALAMMLSATACAASVQKIEKNPDGTIKPVEKKDPETPQKKKAYKDMTLDEQLEYMAAQPSETAAASDNGMLAPVSNAKDKWGYIRSDGSWAIEPRYAFGYAFSDGIAPVLDGYSEYNFIYPDGSKYISTIGKKSILASTHQSEGILPVTLDLGQDQNKVYYLGDDVTIDATNFPKTNGVKYMNNKYFMVTTQFFGGKAVVMRRTNENLLATGENSRETIEKKNLWQSAYVINTKGEILVTLPAGLDIIDYGFDSNGIIIVQDKTKEDGLYGLYDANGNQITECEFRRIEHCDGDNYLVCDQDTGFWGYISKNGKQITGCNFIDAYAFSDGLAAVFDGNGWGVIDESGQQVIDFVWDSFASLKAANLDTNVGSAAFAFGVAVAKKGEYWALIDAKGNIKYAVKSETCPFGSLSGGLVSYCENGLWGFMNSDGKTVITPQFNSTGTFGK